MNTNERPPMVDEDEDNEYEETGVDLFDEEEELDFDEDFFDREEGHIYESIEDELGEEEEDSPNDDDL